MQKLKQLLVLAPLLAYGFYVIDRLAPGRDIASDERQRWILVLFSAVCSIPVLAVHWLYPPHPKFLLLTKRKICIRVHVVAGIAEYAAAVVAITHGNPQAAKLMAAVAILAHIPSAAMQTPIVFGARIVMVPSYVLCVALHFYCAVHLWLEPTSRFWLVQTFLTFSIYAWVRLFYYAFQRWRLFTGWSYTTAVLFAGALIAPAVLGPLAVPFLVSFVAFYVLLYWLVMWPTRDELIDNSKERRRGTYASAKLRRVWRAFRQRAAETPSPTKDLPDDEKAREVFRMLDTDADGILQRDEIRKAMLDAGAAPNFVDMLAGYLEDKKIDCEFFMRRIWEFGVLRHLESATPLKPKATAESQAKMVFDRLDLDGSGHISLFEFWTLLTEWDLPPSDVDECIKKYGDACGKISFETFRDRLRPVWSFAYHDVIARPLQDQL